MNKWFEDVCGSTYYVIGSNVVIGENGTILNQSNEDMVVKLDKVLENMKEGFKISTQKQAELVVELQRTKSSLSILQQEITDLASSSKEMKSKLCGIMEKVDAVIVSKDSDITKHIQNGVKACHELMKKTTVDKMKKMEFANIPVLAKPLIRMLRYKYGFDPEKLRKVLQISQLPTPLGDESFATEDDIGRILFTWLTINSEDEKLSESLKLLLDKLDREMIDVEQVRILSNVLSTSNKTDKVEVTVVETGNVTSQGQLLVEICKRTKEVQTAQKSHLEHMQAVQQSNIKILSEGIATIFEKLLISSSNAVGVYQHGFTKSAKYIPTILSTNEEFEEDEEEECM